MGQAQFMPSSYLSYAVDFDGDGRPDIWRSVPDVLASIANYLHKAGWRSGLPWGFEVNVPEKFDYRTSRGTFRQWADRGFTRADGAAFLNSGDAILFFPSGAAGPAFLVTGNFIVLKQFNNSDAYALAVGELSDRLRGLAPIRAPWPANDFQPSRGERMALQRRLADLGFKVADFNGHIDFDLHDDIRQMQRRFGMIADGYPSRALLERIGVMRPAPVSSARTYSGGRPPASAALFAICSASRRAISRMWARTFQPMAPSNLRKFIAERRDIKSGSAR